MRELNLYMRAFKRQLCLESSTKTHIIQDLQCELEQRLEHGETWAQIKEGLGEPVELATKMNQEFADKACLQLTPWRWLALGFAVVFATTALIQKSFIFRANIDFVVCAFWFCISIFLLLGWCQKGTSIRLLAPLFLLVCGVVSWLVLQGTQTGTMYPFFYARQVQSLSFLGIIISLFSSGIWLVGSALCIVLYALIKQK